MSGRRERAARADGGSGRRERAAREGVASGQRAPTGAPPAPGGWSGAAPWGGWWGPGGGWWGLVGGNVVILATGA